MSIETQTLTPTEPSNDRKALRVIGWFSMGMAVASISIYVGYELISRYKFRHRTPYDFYAGAEAQPMNEFGVGI